QFFYGAHVPIYRDGNLKKYSHFLGNIGLKFSFYQSLFLNSLITNENHNALHRGSLLPKARQFFQKTDPVPKLAQVPFLVSLSVKRRHIVGAAFPVLFPKR